MGGAKTDYIRASGMTLARIAGSTMTWLHHDHLGSAVAGTNASGAVVWRESEQPFGEDWTTAAANDNQAGYTGHVEDAATGLTYMQARYYDPVIGRFLSIDPVGFTPKRPDMFNRYAYAANDPVNMWDPFGKDYRCTPGGESDGGIGSPKMDCSTVWDREGGSEKKRTSKDYEKESAEWRGNVERSSQVGPQVAEQRDENMGLLLDELPVVGEAKSFVDFAENPTWGGSAMAVFGIVPGGKQLAKDAPEKLQSLADRLHDWMGSGTIIKRNDGEAFVAISSDGKRRFRIDFLSPDGDDAHAHLESAGKGSRLRDATSKHRIYFDDDIDK